MFEIYVDQKFQPSHEDSNHKALAYYELRHTPGLPNPLCPYGLVV